jgi:hypothetical protein
MKKLNRRTFLTTTGAGSLAGVAIGNRVGQSLADAHLARVEAPPKCPAPVTVRKVRRFSFFI